MAEEHRASDRSNQRPFFGIPIVGFFDQRKRKAKNHTNEGRPLLARQNERPTAVQFSDQAPQVHNYGNTGDGGGYAATEGSEARQRKRSGKELWAILRHHVHHETFHIHDSFKDTVRRVNDNVRFDDTAFDLPYDFQLSHCFWALVAYLGISILAFSFLFEKWSIIDSMYFAVVTFTTIGYGDISPTTASGRLFCSLFALAGVAVLAIGLGVVGSKIIEGQVQTMTKAQDTMVKDVLSVFQSSPTNQQKLQRYQKQDSDSDEEESSSFSYLANFDKSIRVFKEDLKQKKNSYHPFYQFCRQFGKLLRRYGPALLPLFVGASIIGHYEGWAWYDTIYYCVVTTTTIGYGDFTPSRESLKLFAVLFIPLSVGAMGHFLGTVANFIMDQRQRVFDKKLWRHELTLEDLESMSRNHDGSVTELDFVLFMLQAMKKVDTELIEKIRDHFRRLDLTQSGTLERADLELMARKKLRHCKEKLRLSAYKRRVTRQGSYLQEELGEAIDEIL